MKKLIKSIAKYAIKHNCEVSLEAKDWRSKGKTIISDSGTVDTGLILNITPKGADDEVAEVTEVVEGADE